MLADVVRLRMWAGLHMGVRGCGVTAMNEHTTDWKTLREAAAWLGVSVDTVRRRIDRGDLRARREERPQGYRWLVDVSEAPSAPAPRDPGASTQDTSGQALAVAEAENRVLRETVTLLSAELEARRREASELHRMIAALGPGTQHPTLQMPGSHVVRHESAPHAAAGGHAHVRADVQRAPWWQWWRRRG
jgi:excisionase family DNA binding protein